MGSKRILQRWFYAFILMLRVRSAENLHEIHMIRKRRCVPGAKPQRCAEPRLPGIGVHAETQMQWMCRHYKHNRQHREHRQHRQCDIHFGHNFSENSFFEVWKFALWANHSGRWMLGQTQYNQLIQNMKKLPPASLLMFELRYAVIIQIVPSF